MSAKTFLICYDLEKETNYTKCNKRILEFFHVEKSLIMDKIPSTTILLESVYYTTRSDIHKIKNDLLTKLKQSFIVKNLFVAEIKDYDHK